MKRTCCTTPPLGEHPPENGEQATPIQAPHQGAGNPRSKLVSRCGVWVLVLLISAYQACIRPLLIGHCPFWPSCSDYAAGAIARHGMRRGAWLAIKRLGRCRPFSRGGYDPVP